MSAAKAKRTHMKWERYHERFPQSGPQVIAAGRQRVHWGHVNAHSRLMFIGRYAPHGIRVPYILDRPRWEQ